ncbi:outer membrane beta-barrel domain-containing protein [candidate division GN15 bacterium]|uniref:Outer membrane beta-barrel domain-containing protein n=1 Tax=candidate division GN15 bacterium TaxID=2072418 RepID=A0A855X7G8_9BACT|nr:MAG: outer membrane beta-barrel domain-containing protein [candidate division GN15 bacterium]
MKTRVLFIALIVLLLAAQAGATDFKGKTIAGVRFPFFIPLHNGSNFTTVTGNREPFMMGWNFGAEVKRGFGSHVLIGLTGNYLTTHDDTTAVENAGGEFTSSKHATAKLTGLMFGLEGQWYYEPDWRFQPYLLAGVGLDFWKVKNVVSSVSHKASDFNFKIGTGLLCPINDKFAIDAQVKLTTDIVHLSQDFPAGFYGPNDWKKYSNRPFKAYLEPTLGLNLFFGGELDSDHDGVPDSKDKCPNTPAGVKVDKTGCPLDSDGDGVPDYLDKCPDTPKGVKVDANGCPIDSDGDGVPDYLDKCPDTPKGVKVDAEGCAPDADGDGVPDQLDKCPDTPKGAPVDANGCPLDSDGDGVPDYLDKCPGTPKGVKVDADGCPLVKKITEKITLNIKYATNSYEPDAKSKLQLDSIAERIIAYPETKIEIRGYTDNRGTAAKNMTLSENRANGVMSYLVSKGVPAVQLTAQGYGMDPKYYVADNATEAGRAKNRRVEIESVK